MKKTIKGLLILMAFLYFYNANCKSMRVNIPEIQLSTDPITGELIPEIWKNVTGYDGAYEISNYGRLYSNHYNRLLTVVVHKKGYLEYILSKNNLPKKYKAHRLVAIEFVSNPNNLPQVNHKKGIKTDNRSWELEWTSNLENNRHSWSELGRKSTGQIKQMKPVYQFSFDGFLIGNYSSVAEAAKETGSTHIDAVCRGERKSAGGYKWSY